MKEEEQEGWSKASAKERISLARLETTDDATLARLAQDPDWAVRMQVASRAAFVKRNKAAARRLLKDENKAVRACALKSIGRLDLIEQTLSEIEQIV
jgi:HEAT repeat protein